MNLPQVKTESINKALEYIDENGVPDINQSTEYDLIIDDGKKYPPKYVIAVADHLENENEISTSNFNSIQARNYLKDKGFKIISKQEKFELRISADNVTSTDSRFTMDNLSLGDNYKFLNTYYLKASGEKIERKYSKGERKKSNMVMPRLAFQIFEDEFINLSDEDKRNFPICRYNPKDRMRSGIYSSVDDFKENCMNSFERMRYFYGDNKKFVIYCWNLFSTIIFVQECIKRFGEPGDEMVLIYREKEKKEEEKEKEEEEIEEEYQNPYSSMLIESKNIIFRGAPGTGKSHLAKEIATDIVSNGYVDDVSLLTDDQKKQIEFVQFHPSYDYSDFVEGLRPVINDDGTMSFNLQDGIFKKFVERARRNYENSLKSKETIEKELLAQEALSQFFDELDYEDDVFKTKNGSKFRITNVDEKNIQILIPNNTVANKVNLKIEDLKRMLESEEDFDKIRELKKFFNTSFPLQRYSYYLALYRIISKKMKEMSSTYEETEELKKYVFIIDEINRGEISKIFGELFFSIDPGYRGISGEISTQYSNLHENPNEKFYIPKNLYIIGTMNDIDRSVDSFDFAMRRRFRFIELTAIENTEMLASLEDEDLIKEAVTRMNNLNEAISEVEELNRNYHIGAAYFLKLDTLDFDQLWTDYIHPLLQEYIQGMYGEDEIMAKFEKAYGYNKPSGSVIDETVEN